jgi:hypothetical protein
VTSDNWLPDDGECIVYDMCMYVVTTKKSVMPCAVRLKTVGWVEAFRWQIYVTMLESGLRLY